MTNHLHQRERELDDELFEIIRSTKGLPSPSAERDQAYERWQQLSQWHVAVKQELMR